MVGAGEGKIKKRAGHGSSETPFDEMRIHTAHPRGQNCPRKKKHKKNNHSQLVPGIFRGDWKALSVLYAPFASGECTFRETLGGSFVSK